MKKEPATQSDKTANAATSASEDYLLQPRDFRESNLVTHLRDMGFVDTQEILTALRAVAAEREEISIVAPNTFGGPFSTSGWSTQEHVEAAMMWIVSSREEAEEAKKMDEARISSEQADDAMVESRRQEMERELRSADLVDLIGSVEEDNAGVRSKYFPHSTLLKNRCVKTVLKAVARQNLGKEQVIRLLDLESKARKWYGTVLPYCYFQYALCPRFERYANEIPASGAQNLIQRLSNEGDQLEQAMFNLSEQEEGGVGNVPKLFLAAQKEASQDGKPTGDSCQDVQVLQLPRASKAGKFGASSSTMEVIDIT